jgi:SAM-dependent methyltransferase
VPGCGIGHDAHLLALSGYHVTALDLSPTAIRLAKEKYGGGENLTFREGDFLGDPPDEKYDLVFEHTLFCAIEIGRRKEYAQALEKVLKPGGHFLAIHFFIPKEQDEPPFGTDLEEVTGLFSPFLDLIEQWTPRHFPNREDEEQMFLWKKP